MDDKKKVQEAILQESTTTDEILEGASGGGICEDAEIHCPKCNSTNTSKDHTEKDDSPLGGYKLFRRCNNCGNVWMHWHQYPIYM